MTRPDPFARIAKPDLLISVEEAKAMTPAV
jgi:hypothetical protein